MKDTRFYSQIDRVFQYQVLFYIRRLLLANSLPEKLLRSWETVNFPSPKKFILEKREGQSSIGGMTVTKQPICIWYSVSLLLQELIWFWRWGSPCKCCIMQDLNKRIYISICSTGACLIYISIWTLLDLVSRKCPHDDPFSCLHYIYLSQKVEIFNRVLYCI